MTLLWIVIAVEVAVWGGLSAVGCYVETKRLRERRATRAPRPVPVLSTDDRIAQLILDGRLEVAALNPDKEPAMTIIPDRLPALDNLILTQGAHTNLANGACVMEAVAYIAGEPWTDHPQCASPVIATFLRTWNDQLDDETRQDLKQYIPRLVGSAGTPDQENQRAWMATDWLVRTFTPAWLRLAGLDDRADTIANLPEFRPGLDIPSVRPTIDAARRDAAAARDAAWDAAGAAARAAAWAAAWAAGWDAARAAAWDAARAAARDAAWDAARAAAWAAARAAAGAAAWAAARDAAWDAARDALAPTVTGLQGAAHQLVDRMLAVTGN